MAFNFASEDDARKIKIVLNEKLEAKKQRRLGELHYAWQGKLLHWKLQGEQKKIMTHCWQLSSHPLFKLDTFKR